jgi:hypothetical protein
MTDIESLFVLILPAELYCPTIVRNLNIPILANKGLYPHNCLKILYVKLDIYIDIMEIIFHLMEIKYLNLEIYCIFM